MRHQVQHDQSKAEHVRFERVVASDFFVFEANQLGSKERNSAQDGGFSQLVLLDYLTTAHVTQLHNQFAAVHYEDVLGFDVAVGDAFFLE